MNERTNILNTTLNPVLALMVYENGGADYYLESHDVDEKGNILSGKPLMQETISGIVETLYESHKERAAVGGIYPECLLHYQESGRGYKLVWYRPHSIKDLFFKKDLGVPVKPMPIPAHVFVADGSNLRVFAIHSSSRPTEETILYMPPFLNCSDEGDVCLGSAKAHITGKKTFSSVIEYWEKLFWESTFSHLNGREKMRSGDTLGMWRKIAGQDVFPYDELLPTKKKVRDLI